MSTPQDPGSGATPQDPSDPQNPYGTPTPPTTPIPPAPPVYGTEPAEPPGPPASPPAAPTYGEPAAAPTYGEPAPSPTYGEPAAAPPPPPSYGQPQPGYGQPASYPAPQYGVPGTSNEPGRGMAIAALVLSFFGCVVLGALIAIPLAIVVLVRSKDGRNHGKGLAIAAIAVSLVTLALPVIGLLAGVGYVNSLTDVEDLRPGDCITAGGLTDADADTVTDIKTVPCSEGHDGEVLATVDLTADQADNYAATPISEICGPAIEAAGKAGVISETVLYTVLSVPDPGAGDPAACVAYHADGSDLTGKLGS